MNSCVQIPSNYFNCNLFDLTFPQMNTNASKEILKGTIDGLRFELGVWLHPNILNHKDYKFFFDLTKLGVSNLVSSFNLLRSVTLTNYTEKNGNLSKNRTYTHKLWDNHIITLGYLQNDLCISKQISEEQMNICKVSDSTYFLI